MYVEYRLTPDDWLAYYEHQYDQSSTLRETMTRARWRNLPWMLGVAMLAGLAFRSWMALGVAVLFVVVWFAEYPREFRKRWHQNIARLITPERNPCLNGLHRLEVLPNGIRVTCDMSDTTMPWRRLTNVAITPDDIFITLTGDCGFVIPKAGVVAGEYELTGDALRQQAPDGQKIT